MQAGGRHWGSGCNKSEIKRFKLEENRLGKGSKEPFKIFEYKSATDDPLNGGLPAQSSYKTQPKDHISELDVYSDPLKSSTA